jgi:uncharacterized cupredoxin-like copper-binding protein
MAAIERPCAEQEDMKAADRLRVRSVLGVVWMIVAPRVLAHEQAAHGGGSKAAKKEQKDWGIAGDDRSVKRTIEVGMGDDMRFTPDHIEVSRGDTVRFILRNRGRLLHEFVIGTRQELDDHAALMLKFPSMEHDEPYMAHVAPGETGRIVWNFNRAGEFHFACLIAGHYQAGMVGRVTVRAR